MRWNGNPRNLQQETEDDQNQIMRPRVTLYRFSSRVRLLAFEYLDLNLVRYMIDASARSEVRLAVPKKTYNLHKFCVLTNTWKYD